MDAENIDLETFKYKPVLNKSNYSKENSSEGFKFKKVFNSKPVRNCIDSIYVSKELKVKKKLLFLKPFERKQLVNVYQPVLGRKVSYEKRSVSVVPKAKEPSNVYKMDDLILPILSLRHKKIQSKS